MLPGARCFFFFNFFFLNVKVGPLSSEMTATVQTERIYQFKVNLRSPHRRVHRWSFFFFLLSVFPPKRQRKGNLFSDVTRYVTSDFGMRNEAFVRCEGIFVKAREIVVRRVG